MTGDPLSGADPSLKLTGASRTMRHAARASVVLGAVFVVTFLGFGWRARFPVPYIDDWDWLAALEDPAPFTRSLWRLHNEHLVVVPRLLVWLDFWLWGWPGWSTFSVGLASHAAVAVVLIDCARRRHTRLMAHLLSGTVLVLVFLTYQLQGVVFPASVLFPLVAGSAAMAMWALCRAPSEATSFPWRHVLVSTAFAAVAMLSLTNGLALPFLLALLTVAIGISKWSAAFFVLVGLAGAGARYVAGGIPSSAFTMAAPRVVGFGLAFLGGPLAAVSAPLAMSVGALSLVFALRALWTVWRERRAKVAVDRSNWTLAGVLIFGLMSAVLAAPSRAQYGFNNAAQSRYVILVSAYWAAVLLLSVPRTGRGVTRRSLSVVLPTVALIALPLQILIGIVWVAKADHLATASLALATGVWDSEWIWRLHPLGEQSIRPHIAPLSARGAAFLHFPERDMVSDATTSVRSCHGDVEALDPTLGGQEGSTGLRIEGFIEDPGAALFVSDKDGLIRGKARAAPLVPYGRAYANEFAVTVIGLLTKRRDRAEPSWLGFSTRGSGAPYTAELHDAQGGLVCRAPVSCCSAPPAIAYPPMVVGAIEREGSLDTASCDGVNGWVWDARRGDEPIEVRITASNGADATVLANASRADLVAAGKGNGHHAFTIGAPSFLLGPGTWRVDATIVDTGQPLSGSPRTIVCP